MKSLFGVATLVRKDQERFVAHILFELSKATFNKHARMRKQR
jgi:hypothetical protein